ncbi:Cyclophilin-like protein [Glarea lozoyensis ATCC 20868]|uniref:peptidylprolyl isomerase n=1 Tax=Glarea lozoyensis (strain ATCC 20868 / MF5171) TaxID=1116229 RepID=S3CXA2_GLAL2|nr:Cyclophilin-like protein [Glarea lozoyensis ATCC 20868]EPE30972.1 Cyclophilin-like protein [Glarea lozoyensis ATCC 20868]
MSSLYNLEPQPTASCIFHTTSGDISLELWAQQVPLASRNFLQLALDGYYDNTIFHRLVPGFILQGGDPTGTGNGGESIYDGGAYSEARELGGIWPMEDRKGKNAGMHGVGFKDEWHSRIKYNRRGLLGMANDGTADSNGSQFFITLGNTPELQGRNTLFGRVEGETIYNVAKMGEAEVGEGERPIYPTRVTSVEILVNPFKDMVRRVKEVVPVVEEKKVERKKKRKGKQLLSFGGEEEEDVQPVVKRKKFDERIVVDDGEVEEVKAKAPKESKKRVVKPVSIESSPEPAPLPKALPNRAAKVESRDVSSSPEPVQKVSSLLDRTNAQIAELKASMKRNVAVAPTKEKKKSALEELIPVTSIRGRKRRPGGNAPPDEQGTLDMLTAFKSQLDAAPPEKEVPKPEPIPGTAETKDAEPDDDEAALCDLHFIAGCESCKKWDTQADGEEEEEDDNDWMSHALSFKEDKLGKDLSYRQKALEELVVIDPREKERTLKEEMKAKRDARSGGGTGREWDQARNKKMARASAAAGRAAR